MTEHTIKFVMDEDDTTLTRRIHENGYITGMVIVIPNWTNTITATLTITDRDDNVLWSKASMANNTTYRVPAPMTDAQQEDIPVDYNYKAVFALSGAAGGTGGTATVKFMVMNV